MDEPIKQITKQAIDSYAESHRVEIEAAWVEFLGDSPERGWVERLHFDFGYIFAALTLSEVECKFEWGYDDLTIHYLKIKDKDVGRIESLLLSGNDDFLLTTYSSDSLFDSKDFYNLDEAKAWVEQTVTSELSALLAQ
jgi:hypothetical protein